VRTQPGNPLQTCSISSGSGTLAGANLSNAGVSCVTAVVPPGPPTSCVIGGLAPNQTYAFTVTAANSAGAGAGAPRPSPRR
jgi:hypothetical protein